MPNPYKASTCRNFSFHLTIESPHLSSPEACHGQGHVWETGAVSLGLGNCFNNTEHESHAMQNYQMQVGKPFCYAMGNVSRAP